MNEVTCEVLLSFEDQVMRCQIRGDLDLDVVPVLEAALDGWIRMGRPVEVNLSAAQYVGADTLHMLERVQARAATSGGDLRLITRKAHDRILALAGLEKVILVEKPPDDRLANPGGDDLPWCPVTHRWCLQGGLAQAEDF